MSTLLLRLAGPLQSWGTDSKFDVRRTGREPSKSGVIGMVAAALGIQREEDERIRELAGLRFGVREDREGKLLRDYQTVKAKQNKIYGPAKDMAYVTSRYYLSDAAFVVGLEGERELLEEILEALRHPYYPLYLGRRSCPPTGKLVIGIEDLCLEDALRGAPFSPSVTKEKKTVRMVTEICGESEAGRLVHDQPVSFSQKSREFAFRRVKETTFMRDEAEPEEHDPMKELE